MRPVARFLPDRCRWKPVQLQAISVRDNSSCIKPVPSCIDLRQDAPHPPVESPIELARILVLREALELRRLTGTQTNVRPGFTVAAPTRYPFDGHGQQKAKASGLIAALPYRA
ncbi:hypothetical protein ZHAS_00019637 [Anopheles sinensis]|uniref:Uncharacterized protein n=1 Tax=Anopheles sinensis TaxID=74873 RepID=A0A084WMX4_ANOSI|nr:hypothetical protein ZHAS_00019637 [Anopheles sinensis]